MKKISHTLRLICTYSTFYPMTLILMPVAMFQMKILHDKCHFLQDYASGFKHSFE